MDNFVVTATSMVTEADVQSAKLGTRFGRLDLASQLALLAVEALGIDFESHRRDRVGICLAACAGSLTTDVEYWNGCGGAGGPSPTLFAYTLPSAAIGEIAIRHKLTGPNLCLVGANADLRAEAAQMIGSGEADSCLCVECDVISPALAQIIGLPATARASAEFVQRAAGILPTESSSRRKT